MYARTLCICHVEYSLRVHTPLHVGGGGSFKAHRSQTTQKKCRGPDYNVTVGAAAGDGQTEVVLPLHRRGAGGPVFYIPGTSLRGALRHALGRALDRALSGRRFRDEALLHEDRPPEECMPGDPGGPLDLEDYWQRFHGSPPLRHLFGTSSRRGALHVSDAEVTARSKELKTAYTAYSDFTSKLGGGVANADLRILTHNRLDRFTMASTEGLRNLAAIEAGTIFRGEIRIDNFGWWQVGALAVALRGLHVGAIRLGTRGAVGLGQVRMDVPNLRITLGWHKVIAPKSGDALPGVGARLLEFVDGDPRQRALGQKTLMSPAGDSHPMRLFLLDEKGDTLDTTGMPGGEAHATRTFDPLVYQQWKGEDAERLLARASNHLIALLESETDSEAPSIKQTLEANP